MSSVAHADDRADLAKHTCAALDQAVLKVETDGPLLLPSYQLSPDKSQDFIALRDVAFTYDNALAGIALFACGKPASARRIVDALVLAASSDPEYHDGRIRNAYLAGPVKGPTMSLPGYWSIDRKAWVQDAYQVSFATGNAAWAALAALEAFRRTRHPPYLDAAKRMLGWIADNTLDANVPAGFIGGYFGAGPNPARQGWKSTEQNVDLAAAWSALDRLAPSSDAKAKAAIAASFVAGRWDAKEGRFLIGTGPDGQAVDHGHSGLDAQIWPLIAMPRLEPDWMRVLAFVDAGHGSRADTATCGTRMASGPKEPPKRPRFSCCAAYRAAQRRFGRFSDGNRRRKDGCTRRRSLGSGLAWRSDQTPRRTTSITTICPTLERPHGRHWPHLAQILLVRGNRGGTGVPDLGPS